MYPIAARVSPHYPRDLIGYGATPPDPRWPGGARLALQIVLNYEEGAERSVLHGDAASETFLSEIVAAEAFQGARHMTPTSLVWFRQDLRLADNPALQAALDEGGAVLPLYIHECQRGDRQPGV